MTDATTTTQKSQKGEENDVGISEHNENASVYQISTLRTTGFIVFFSLWISLSGWMVNFDLGYGGTVLQMSSFKSTFGTCSMVPNDVTGKMEHVCKLTATAQSVVSLSSLFVAIGAGLSGIIGSYIGRRGTLHAGCVLIIIGAAGQCGTAGNYVAYNACKSISCVGIGLLNAGSPLYGVEVTPPSKRGALVAIYSIGTATGTLIVACVCYGTSQFIGDWQWRTPILLQIPLALIYALGLFLFPESPRWLLIKGREEQARKSFGRFYNKDPYSDEITVQVQEVQTYLEVEKSTSSTTSWTELFHQSYIRRTMISFMPSIIAPLSGIALVGTYAAVFFAANGVSEPFLIQVYLGVCGLVGGICGPAIVEYGGRRFASLLGFAVMSVCMLIFSAVASGVGSATETARNTLIAFLCIWFFVYASCVASSHWLVAAEIHSVRLRGHGQASSVAVASVLTFASNFWTPYMINPTAGNLGTKVGYFYFGLDIVGLILVFLFLPETARLSLEQIDDYFASRRPAWRTSTSRNKKIAKGELYDIPPEAHLEARQQSKVQRGHKGQEET